jgi:hypothetical protein
MQLVEQLVISTGDPRYALIDQAAFASKNLYNQANYQIRQAFLQADVNGSYNTLRKAFPNAFPESLLGEQGIVGPAVAPCRLVDKSREDTGSSVSMSRLNG